MKKYLFYFLSAIILFSCSKESVNVAPEQESSHLVYKTFTVSSTDTKTYLDGMSVKWAADDKINVIAYGTGNQYTFTLKSGANTSSAVFEGNIAAADAEETKFIAVYPDVSVSITKDANPEKEIIEYWGSTSGDHVKYYIDDVTPVKAVKNGFDGRYAPMTAVLDGGNFVFRHGAAYIKLRMSEAGVKKVKLEAGGSARFNGRPKYLLSTGLNSTVESAKAYIYASPEEGTFEKNAVYYIPVLTKQSNVGDLTITYTLEDGITSNAVKTSALSTKKLTAGLVYDLGTPPITFSPTIRVTAPSKLEATATDGSFTYSVLNPDGVSAVTAAIKSGTWISNVAVSASAVTFDCTANTGEERTAVITLTYTGAEDVDVTITQKAAGSAASEDYVWDFSTSGWQSAMDTQASGAKDAKADGWSVTYSGLTYVSGDGDRWSVNGYIQPNGSGYYKESGERRYFLFEVEGGGYVYVKVKSNSSSNKTADICAQLGKKNTADFTQSVTSNSSSFVTTELGPFTKGGTIVVFLGGSGHRIYSIEFHTSQQN